MIGIRNIDGGNAFLAFGNIALDGSNPTPVVTGLSKIFPGCHGASLNASAAPGLGTSTLSTQPVANSGTLNINAFMPTSAGNPTLIASTGVELLNWWAVGER